MSHLEGSLWGGGWHQEVPEQKPVLVPTRVNTNLEAEVSSLAWQEWAMIRCCDSARCIGCGSGFAERCFFRGKVLTKARCSHQAGSRYVLLVSGQV